MGLWTQQSLLLRDSPNGNRIAWARWSPSPSSSLICLFLCIAKACDYHCKTHCRLKLRKGPGGGLQAALRGFQLMQRWCCWVYLFSLRLCRQHKPLWLVYLQVPDHATWGGSWNFLSQEESCPPGHKKPSFTLTSHVQFVRFCFHSQFLLLSCSLIRKCRRRK